MFQKGGAVDVLHVQEGMLAFEWDGVRKCPVTTFRRAMCRSGSVLRRSICGAEKGRPNLYREGGRLEIIADRKFHGVEYTV